MAGFVYEQTFRIHHIVMNGIFRRPAIQNGRGRQVRPQRGAIDIALNSTITHHQQMTLEQHIEDMRAGIKVGRFGNEAAVSQGIGRRLLHALGWPAYDTQIVCPEYSLEGRRVDFGLCHPPGRSIAFVEVKQIGQSEGAERQLFE